MSKIFIQEIHDVNFNLTIQKIESFKFRFLDIKILKKPSNVDNIESTNLEVVLNYKHDGLDVSINIISRKNETLLEISSLKKKNVMKIIKNIC